MIVSSMLRRPIILILLFVLGKSKNAALLTGTAKSSSIARLFHISTHGHTLPNPAALLTAEKVPEFTFASQAENITNPPVAAGLTVQYST